MFALARASWPEPAQRPRALDLARRARARLADLRTQDATTQRQRVDAWLAGKSAKPPR